MPVWEKNSQLLKDVNFTPRSDGRLAGLRPLVTTSTITGRVSGL
jgi:hypothetical protein